MRMRLARSMVWLARSVWLPLVLLLLNLPLNHAMMNGRLPASFAWIVHVWAGAVVVVALRWACCLPRLADRSAWLQAFVHALWMYLWLVLPIDHMIRLLGLVAYFVLNGMALWSRRRAVGWRPWVALSVGGGGVPLGLLLMVLQSPWRSERLWTSIFPSHPNWLGAHFELGQVLKTLGGLRPFGESALPWGPFVDRVQGVALLRLGHDVGWVSMLALASAMLLGWVALWRWLSATPTATHLSRRARGLGLTLVVMHGVVTLLNVLWNLGQVSLPMGVGLLPLVWHGGWLVLSVSLAWVCVNAKRQRSSLHQGAGESAANMEDLPSRWGRTGVTLGLAGLAGALLVAVGAVLLEQSRHYYLYALAPSPLMHERMDLQDRHWSVVATTVSAFDLWVRPRQFWGRSLANPHADSAALPAVSDAQLEQRLLSSLQTWPKLVEVVQARLQKTPKDKDDQMLLSWAVPAEVADAVRNLNLEGLTLSERPTRYYNEGSLYAHVLGFVGLSDIFAGQDGMELAENRRLVEARLKSDPKRSTVTALDPDTQRIARTALGDGMREHGATGGAVVVVDVATAEVRALVSAPDFDPNDASTFRNPYQPERIKNRAVASPFAAGALLTPLLVAQALETGRLEPGSRIALDGGKGLNVGSVTLQGVGQGDSLTVAEVVSKSSSIGAAKLALSMNLVELQGVVQNSGLHGQWRFPGMTMGVLPDTDWRAWTPVMQSTAGQQLPTTLVRAVQAYLPLATGGVQRPLSLFRNEASDLGRSSDAKQVLSAETACLVRRMLHAAAGPTGTAPKAQVAGISVAGKTATVRHLPVMDEAGHVAYEPQSTAVFVGMAPAQQPRWLVGVMLEFEPSRTRLAGDVAAPVFSEVIDGLARQENVPREISVSKTGEKRWDQCAVSKPSIRER